MKLGKLKQADESLKKLLTADLPVQEAYKLSRVVARISEELTAAEKIRNDLVMKKYGVKKDDKFAVPPEKLEEFYKEYNTLLDVEVDIPIVKIKLDSLNGAKLSAVDLHNLDFIFEEEKEK